MTNFYEGANSGGPMHPAAIPRYEGIGCKKVVNTAPMWSLLYNGPQDDQKVFEFLGTKDYRKLIQHWPRPGDHIVQHSSGVYEVIWPGDWLRFKEV